MKKIKINKLAGFKTFDAEDVIKAGGTSKFSKLMGFDPKKLSNLQGVTLSEIDYQKALSLLRK